MVNLIPNFSIILHYLSFESQIIGGISLVNPELGWKYPERKMWFCDYEIAINGGVCRGNYNITPSFIGFFAIFGSKLFELAFEYAKKQFLPCRFKKFIICDCNSNVEWWFTSCQIVQSWATWESTIASNFSNNQYLATSLKSTITFNT